MARRVGTQFLIVRTDILPTRIYYPELRQSMDLAVVDWSDRVDEIMAVVPERCRHGQQPLPEPAGRRDGRVWRHQVVELLPLAVRVTEYQMIARRCPSYGKRTRPDRPAGVPRRPFGARLTAVIGLLSGRYRLSRGEVRQVLQDLWHVRLSLGAVVRRRHATGAERLLLADLRCHGDTFWTRFSGGRDGTLWYYCALVAAYRERGASRLVEELDRVVSEAERLAGVTPGEADYAQREQQADRAMAVIHELQGRVRTGGRSFTRDDMNER